MYTRQSITDTAAPNTSQIGVEGLLYTQLHVCLALVAVGIEVSIIP